VRWDLNTTEYLQSPTSSPKEERREVLSPIAVRRMMLKPELPINPGPVERAIETTKEAIVSREPNATTASASRESASSVGSGPKTKLKGFSFGGSSKGKKGDAFQEWKRSKPEKLSESLASAGETSVSKASVMEGVAKATTGTEHADPSAAGPSLPLALVDTVQARHIEEPKAARRTFGTPAPGPIMMQFA
jgi:hypothetical protein